MIESQSPAKIEVRDFWEQASCGAIYAVGEDARERLEAQCRSRYELEPFIFDFAKFSRARGLDVLEVGVGMGADHAEWAKAGPRTLMGVDLTQNAVRHTQERLALYGFTSDVRVADAENLPFDDESFDIVYSWGVLHHSPDTPRAVREVHRVLRPGGRALVMIYHRYSIVGVVLWLRYALLTGHPARTLDEIYARCLESPGTKAYSVSDAHALFAAFSSVEASTRLSPGDMMEGGAGQRHKGVALSLARRVWPRQFLRRLGRRFGLFLLVDAVK
jgi:SAM-dependent methyltransferase